MPFEQAIIDAEDAAAYAQLQTKLAVRKARERKKHQEELEKNSRRWARQAAARARTPDEHAQCGIRWYCRSPRDRDRGNYWTHCHACGQPLIYTSDPNAKRQECKGRGP
jgi:hypothetical protein